MLKFVWNIKVCTKGAYFQHFAGGKKLKSHHCIWDVSDWYIYSGADDASEEIMALLQFVSTQTYSVFVIKAVRCGEGPKIISINSSIWICSTRYSSLCSWYLLGIDLLNLVVGFVALTIVYCFVGQCLVKVSVACQFVVRTSAVTISQKSINHFLLFQ